MKKKSVKPKKLIDIQCPKCGRITHHYLNEAGEYRCVVCQNVNKTIRVQEVVFEMDAEIDSALNPAGAEQSNPLKQVLDSEENQPV